jgi:hypothetical protein
MLKATDFDKLSRIAPNAFLSKTIHYASVISLGLRLTTHSSSDMSFGFSTICARRNCYCSQQALVKELVLEWEQNWCTCACDDDNDTAPGFRVFVFVFFLPA